MLSECNNGSVRGYLRTLSRISFGALNQMGGSMLEKRLSGLVLLAASSAWAADGTTVSQKDYELQRCDKPIASVVVGKLVCKSAACQPPAQQAGGAGMNPLLQLAMAQAAAEQGQSANLSVVGEGMTAMLTTVLKETGCFEIQEREAMEEMAKELALVGKKVEAQQADYLITGAITSISMVTEKKQLGGGLIPVLGMFSTTKKSAEIGLDIKILDVNRAKLVEAKTFQANNETSSTSFGAAAWGGGALFGGAMSTIKGTPMEPILRQVLAEVAVFTSKRMTAAKQAAQASQAPMQQAQAAQGAASGAANAP